MTRVNRLIKIARYFLANLKNKYFNPLHKTQQINIGGKELNVYRGAFTKIDKDDAWLAFLMKDAKIIFDIGANVGWTALLANVYGDPKHIVLVDPNPMALTYAAGNLILNNFSANATFVKSFVSDKSEDRVKFFTVDTGAAGSMYASHAKTASSLNSWYWVPTVTLDELVSKLKLIPDFIKIDVEGAEHLVLLGVSNVCKENQLKIFVEMHSNEDLTMLKNATQILSWCEDNNYKAWYLTTGEELTTPDQISTRGRCHLLMLPSNLTFPQKLREIKQGDALPVLN